MAPDSPVGGHRGTDPAGGLPVADKERRRHQWEALRVLRKVSRLRRVSACRRRPTGEGVMVGRRGARAHYSGLQTCASVWSCPVCSARIQAERADELLRAVERAHACGLKVALLTLTMRHRKRDKLKLLWDGLSQAWQPAIATDRAVRRARDAVGMVSWVRRVEATHGRKGWHLHVHALLFYGRGPGGPPNHEHGCVNGSLISRAHQPFRATGGCRERGQEYLDPKYVAVNPQAGVRERREPGHALPRIIAWRPSIAARSELTADVLKLLRFGLEPV